MRLITYADAIEKEVEITYHPSTDGEEPSYTARFHRAEVAEGVSLCSAYGVGTTPGEAMESYLSLIDGKVLVFNATGDDREEVMIRVDSSSILRQVRK